MDRRRKVFIVLIILSFFCFVSLGIKFLAKTKISSKVPLPTIIHLLTNKDIDSLLPFPKGEQLIYDVYFKKLKVGKSVLTFHGEDKIDGKDIYRITFSTTLPLFKDFEDIYFDKETFLPVKVFRKINKIGNFPVRIKEEYDQDNFKVKIRKQGKFLSKEFIIKKDAPIHNAIILPYQYRRKPVINEGEKARIILPKADFELVYRGKEVIKTRLGESPAYVFASIPPKFTFWLSADERKIPLKIKSLNVVRYSLVINSIGNSIEAADRRLQETEDP